MMRCLLWNVVFKSKVCLSTINCGCSSSRNRGGLRKGSCVTSLPYFNVNSEIAMVRLDRNHSQSTKACVSARQIYKRAKKVLTSFFFESLACSRVMKVRSSQNRHPNEKYFEWRKERRPLGRLLGSRAGFPCFHVNAMEDSCFKTNLSVGVLVPFRRKRIKDKRVWNLSPRDYCNAYSSPSQVAHRAPLGRFYDQQRLWGTGSQPIAL